MNEHIKSAFHILGPIFEKLFNIILDSGVLPEVWSVGMIKPIYKQKGEKSNPENYRPITLVSCVGKLFTSILSNRLYTYVESNNVFTNTQAGFRKGYSTTDNIFILYSLIEMLNYRKKKLFCAFIDLKQAFDTVWRDGLWWKMVNCNVNGKCLTLIKNMYSNIKSCLVVNGEKTEFFTCNIGLRQGENLSPFLFSVYLNDLEKFFLDNDIDGGVECMSSNLDNDIDIYFKLFILLYADDTVIMSDSSNGLQRALNIYNDYCIQWKLTVNIKKSKVVVFAKGRQAQYSFSLNDQTLDVEKDYKYLGMLFSRSGSFFSATKLLAGQAEKAMFNLVRKSRTLMLPIDLQIDLFNKMVQPFLLYGSEVWGFANLGCFKISENYFEYENKHTKFYGVWRNRGFPNLY